MDTTVLSPRELADRLGVSLPRAHRELDKLGVAPAAGRGRQRAVPADAFNAVADRIGAVPDRFDGLTREDMLVLKSVVDSALGIESVREVARRAGASPTTAGRAIGRLVDRGLVHRRSAMEARGRAVLMQRWVALDIASWDDGLLRALRSVRAPARPRGAPPTRIPFRWHHLFWNAAPEAIELPRDGSYVAGRFMDAAGLESTMWMLRNIEPEFIAQAASRRGRGGRDLSLADLARAAQR